MDGSRSPSGATSSGAAPCVSARYLLDERVSLTPPASGLPRRISRLGSTSRRVRPGPGRWRLTRIPPEGPGSSAHATVHDSTAALGSPGVCAPPRNRLWPPGAADVDRSRPARPSPRNCRQRRALRDEGWSPFTRFQPRIVAGSSPSLEPSQGRNSRRPAC